MILNAGLSNLATPTRSRSRSQAQSTETHSHGPTVATNLNTIGSNLTLNRHHHDSSIITTIYTVIMSDYHSAITLQLAQAAHLGTFVQVLLELY